MTRFGENLKSIAKQRNISLRKLAELSDIDYRIILSYTRDNGVIPNVVYAFRLAECLNTTVEFLVTGKKLTNCKQCFYQRLVSNLNTLSSQKVEVFIQLSEIMRE